MLRGFGVLTVFKLNGAEYPVARESREAGPGIEIRSFDVDQWHPSVKETLGIVSQIEDALSRGAALVHCTHGRDRTGLVIGALRLHVQKWALSRVEQERRVYGVVGLIALADHEIAEALALISGMC
jgi:protein-tyrosine phosphatase